MAKTNADVPRVDHKIDPLERDQDLRRLFSMNPYSHIAGWMHVVRFALEKYLEERCLVNTFWPSRKCDKVIGKSVEGQMSKDIKLLAFKLVPEPSNNHSAC